MICLNLLIITIITVNIIDISDFVTHIKKAIWKWLKGKDRPYQDFEMKPFDCSYCMTFWLGLIYLIVNQQLTLPYLMLNFMLSYLTPYIKDLQLLIGDLLTKIIDWLYNLINK